MSEVSSRHTARRAAIIIIGNEVLSGKVVDINSSYLLKELYALGVKVERVLTIPDDQDLIADTVRQAATQFDYVFTSGGIGPTHDDVTFPAIAQAFDTPLEAIPELMQLLRDHYKGEINAAAIRLATMPKGVELVYTPTLRYPMTIMRNVYIFPGVPELLRAKFDAIRERFREAPYHLTRIFTQQIESALADDLISTLAEFPGVEIGSYPRFDTPDYKVLLTLESKDCTQLTRARDYLLERLDRSCLVEVTGP